MDVRIPTHAADSLAYQLVACSEAPLLLLDSQFIILAASGSFCRAFELEPKAVIGQRMSYLGSGEWGSRQLASLLKATLSSPMGIEEYEMDLERPDQPKRSLILKAHKIEYGDSDNVRLALTIGDVTDARKSDKLKDDLVREKGILLQELQHRVANSLQIIASVLMQNARTVDSDETRVHLYEAHNRVMSVAAIQRHLVPSRLGDVELLPYLTDLCQSIAASMIGDPNQLSLEVTGDNSCIDADSSVSIGLIVTELVMNALKHAFPNHREGRILVDYRSEKDAWTLSVRDDGVGIPTGLFSAKPGLGTGIVAAISKQLEASVTVAAAYPGTRVSICHAAGE